MMADTKHTLTEWWIDDDNCIVTGVGNSYRFIAKVVAIEYIDLIAAAPEMLEALVSCQFELQLICEDLIRESTTHAQLASLTQAKAAIHKAGHLCKIEPVIAEARVIKTDTKTEG